MDIRGKIYDISKEIGKVIIGKEKEIELFVISMLFNGHLLLESVPGTGKTLLAKSFAQTIGGLFSRIQFTPDVLPSDITGIQFFNPKTQEFELRTGPIVANIVLADEINRATPRTQSSLLEAMEERQVTIDGITVVLKEPFMVIATQNPVESQQGTFALPIAQMDRFFMKIVLDYPSYEEEKAIMIAHRMKSSQSPITQVLSKRDFMLLKKSVEDVKLSDDVQSYILEIVRSTREHPSIELGVSPRGSLALMKAAQGKAFLGNREYVTPTDVKDVAQAVLSHRIVLSMEGSLTKTPLMVITDILEMVPVPVEMGVGQ